MALAAILGLSYFIINRCMAIWSEYSLLQVQLERVRTTDVIGYAGIQPALCFADRPSDWFRVEGDQTLLWSGWREGVGHTWFHVRRDEIHPDSISPPMGRDVFQAIDHPLIESIDGPIGARIPYDAEVVGNHLAGVETAYPVLVLTKVFLVNDMIQDRPFLVTYFPGAPESERVAIYEPLVDGQRVTMGTTGFAHQGKFVLYDRGTESFWTPEGPVLRAFAGKHKGRTLNKIGQPAHVAWGLWKSQHPKGRLVVGADRTLAIPKL
jgi:hypothetical protein